MSTTIWGIHYYHIVLFKSNTLFFYYKENTLQFGMIITTTKCRIQSWLWMKYSAVSVDQKPATSFLLSDTALNLLGWVEYPAPHAAINCLRLHQRIKRSPGVFSMEVDGKWHGPMIIHSLVQVLANIRHCTTPCTSEKVWPLRPIWHLRIEIKMSDVPTMQYKIPHLQFTV